MAYRIFALFLLLGSQGLARAQTDGSCASLVSTRNVTQADDDTLCTKVVPGLIRMAQGVDISVLDIFPSDLTSQTGFLRPIFEYTCNQERPWHDPDSSNEYQIPDQVESVIPVPTGTLNIVSRHNEKIKSIKDSMAVKVGLSIGAGAFGSFSASAGYKEAQEQMIKTDTTISETTSTMSAYQVFFQSTRRLKLSSSFQKSVEALPAKYSDNSALYDNFVEDFGTHYFDMAKFGGYLYARSEIDNYFFESSDKKAIDANLKASFKLFVSMDISGDIGIIGESARKDFETNSRVDFCYYGGQNMRKAGSDPNDDGYVKEWRKTVSKNPWLFAGQLKPIQNLVEDASKKESIKLAVVHKLAKAYLDDARNAYNTSGNTISKEEEAALKAIEDKLANPATTITDLEKLDKDLFDLMEKLQRIIDQTRGLPKGNAAEQFRWNYWQPMKKDFSCPCEASGLSLNRCHYERSNAKCPSGWRMENDPESRATMYWYVPPGGSPFAANVTETASAASAPTPSTVATSI